MSAEPARPGHQRLLLDTDIGTDVDDSLAVAMILGSPEMELVGITTVYGDTTLRSRIAKQLLQLARVDRDIPIFAGAQQTLSGRPVWWPGHEGRTYALDSLRSWQPGRGAAEFLVEQASANPGQLDLVAIGPLTNVAAALRLDPRFAENIRTIHIMGASFDQSGPEHNILSDTYAARIVVRSDARVILTPVNITRRVRLAPPLVDEIEAAGNLGKALAAEIRQWMRLQHGEHSIPHDAITALGVGCPQLFERHKSTVDVIVEAHASESEGTTTMRRDVGARTEVVVDLDEASVRREIVDRVCAAGAESLRRP